jgi:hypothetical protein
MERPILCRKLFLWNTVLEVGIRGDVGLLAYHMNTRSYNAWVTLSAEESVSMRSAICVIGIILQRTKRVT